MQDDGVCQFATFATSDFAVAFCANCDTRGWFMTFFCIMEINLKTYVDKLIKFARMKKKLTLFIDEPLIAKMKSMAQNKGTSVSQLVEQYFIQHLVSEETSVAMELGLEVDPFISKFGGILKEYNQLSDEEIKSISMEMRLKHHQ
jgi:hypothetical protein